MQLMSIIWMWPMQLLQIEFSSADDPPYYSPPYGVNWYIGHFDLIEILERTALSSQVLSFVVPVPYIYIWLKHSRKVCLIQTFHHHRRRSKLWWASFYTRLIPTKGQFINRSMAASGNGNENHDVIENTADMYSSNLHQAINSTVICRAATIQDTCYAHGAQRGKKNIRAVQTGR